MVSRTGQCLCGAIKYEMTSDPVVAGICHCKNCQRQAGSAFSTLVGVPRGSLKFSGDELKLYNDQTADSGGEVRRFFCGTCGSPLYSLTEGQPDMAYVKSGTLDDTSGFAPQFNVWCDSKQDWVDLPEGVPAIPKQ
jgi:hypothetical protein